MARAYAQSVDCVVAQLLAIRIYCKPEAALLNEGYLQHVGQHMVWHSRVALVVCFATSAGALLVTHVNRSAAMHRVACGCMHKSAATPVFVGAG